MKIIAPSAVIEGYTPDLEALIEKSGRVCWKSEDRVTADSAGPFIEKLKSFKHESVLEHGSITVRLVCDRGVSHEIVRHRLASFSQESTRYCNYSKGKFGGEVTVIDLSTGFNYDLNDPSDAAKYGVWHRAMAAAEGYYKEMLGLGATPQEARSVLPNSTKTEVVMTANPREWRHVFRLRCDRAAHPQMVEVMRPLFSEFVERWPSLFGDISFTE